MTLSRRAFSLLELGLATVVASIILVATLTLFNAVERTDRKLEGRFERASEIERTRRALQNALTTIATSEQPQPRRSPADGGRPTGSSTPSPTPPTETGGKSGQASQGAENEAGSSLTPTPAPRLVLGPDSGIESDPTLSALGTQRLEIVLTSNPVPVLKREGSEEARMAVDSDSDSRVDTASSGGAQAIRGAFSFRAQTTPPGRDARSDLAARPLMELWWVPLPPAQNDPAAEPLPISMAAGYPAKLCSDIVGSRFRFFREGQWIAQHSAVWSQELPAYAEIQMDFANGQSVRWLMEIDYSIMAEVTPADPEDAAGVKPGFSTPLDGGSGPTRGGVRLNNIRSISK